MAALIKKHRPLSCAPDQGSRIVVGRELQAAVDAITARLDVIERKLGLDTKARREARA